MLLQKVDLIQIVPIKKNWQQPALTIISQNDIHNKNSVHAHEASYHPNGAGKYVNPVFGTAVPKAIVSNYVS